ncbi:hypothetical protein ABZT49_33240 [Methylobacterium sp. EM32]|uniref:ribbon-helix-helix domain-containing protein n=1 Tax=Methylobacterium sp. EM32 TaxID=3163481 RepID=UPI0033B0CBDD
MPDDPSKPPFHAPSADTPVARGDDLGWDRPHSSGDDSIPDIQRLRRAWREGVESGDYQPAEAVFARLQARYETSQNDA